MERILVLITAHDYADAAQALCSAKEKAAFPERLTWGISLMEEPTQEELQSMQALGSAQYLCPGVSSWLDVGALWQGEGFILMAHPAMRFSARWDAWLLLYLQQCKRDGATSAVLTGYLPRPVDPVDAVFPVAAEAFDQDGRLCFHRGTALNHAKAPQRSAFLHPDFCFASSGFFREMAREDDSPLFLRAFRSKWELFTLHRPVLRMQWDMPLLPAEMDLEGDQPPEGLTRFEKRFGMRFATRQLSSMARRGIFTADLKFPVRVPVSVMVRQWLKELRLRRSKLSPLCVTAFLSHAQPEDSLKEEFLCWFSYLSRLKNLALLCYADGSMCRQLIATHPNVLEYKRRYGLQVKEDVPQDEALNYVRLCKPFLLGQSREKMLGHTHYVWVDFGYLRYPVYDRIAVDWSDLCTDKITMAQVEGKPDTSVIVMPQQHVLPLCREITAICQTHREKEGSLPLESQLWEDLIHTHPELFHLIDKPGRRQLLPLG